MTTITKTLYIDKNKMTKSLVTVFNNGKNARSKEVTTTFKKAAGIYGLENEVQHIIKHTSADEVIFCNL